MRTIAPGGIAADRLRPRSAPLRAAHFTRPVSAFRNVLLPAPLAPMIATTSPASQLEVDAEQRLEVAVEAQSGRAVSISSIGGHHASTPM